MFDPYRKWLGIQPKDQPANYYRLLSVDLFETDLDVIEGAADRTMGFVRQYQSGEHAADAARILNELATARLCLLKPEKKAEYDAKLRKDLAVASKPGPEKSLPPLEKSLADVPRSDPDIRPLGVVTKRKKKSAKANSFPVPPVVIGIGVVTCLGLIAFLASGRNERPAEKQAEQRLEPAPYPAINAPLKNLAQITRPAENNSVKTVDTARMGQVEEKPTKKNDDIPRKEMESKVAEKSESKTEEVNPLAATPPSVPAKAAVPVEFSLVRTWQGAMGKNGFGVFSQDGSQFVYGVGNDILIVDTETGKTVTKLTGHKKSVLIARFSSDDHRVVSVAADETLRIWDTSAQKQVSLMKPKINESGTLLVATKNAALIAVATANDRRLTVLNGVTKAELGRIELTEHEVVWRDVTADLKWGLSNGIRNQSTFWNLETKASFQIDNGHHNYCGCFTQDGTRAILGGEYRWESWDFQAVRKIQEGSVIGGHIYAIGLMPGTDRIMVGLADGTVWMFDLTTGQKVTSFKAHEKPIGAVVISPDQQYLITHDHTGLFHLWRLSGMTAR